MTRFRLSLELLLGGNCPGPSPSDPPADPADSYPPEDSEVRRLPPGPGVKKTQLALVPPGPTAIELYRKGAA